MSIFPLDVFEADADPTRRDAMTLEEQLAATEAPKTFVVRFGRMGYIGEYESKDEIRAGCGTKLVVRTHRGIELSTMLTTTCPNSGCPTAVSRGEMRDYIDASGGKEFPFRDRGRVLRIATPEDMTDQMEREGDGAAIAARTRELATFYNIRLKVVDAELILGRDHATVFYQAEERVDFRELAQDLAAEFRCRVDMRQVGARDEARLVADYERCGQHCCCKNFLKVLKPVSMRSAKQQKATLDPLKISGRCGRLMCCLRYEDQTYKELKANLPHRKTRVGTEEGPGIVLDSMILTQLVLVRLEDEPREIAVPIEELLDPDTCPRPALAPPEPDPEEARPKRTRRRRRGAAQDDAASDGTESKGKKRRRRRRRGGGEATTDAKSEAGTPTDDAAPKKKRRRRKRRRRGPKPDSSGE